MGRGLHLAMGSGGVPEGVCRVHDRAYPTGLDERPDVLPDRCDDHRLLRRRPRPEGGRDQGAALGEHRPEVDLGGAPTLQPDDDQPAVDRQQPDVAGEVLRPDGVEDDVRAVPVGGLADDRLEVLASGS